MKNSLEEVDFNEDSQVFWGLIERIKKRWNPFDNYNNSCKTILSFYKEGISILISAEEMEVLHRNRWIEFFSQTLSEEGYTICNTQIKGDSCVINIRLTVSVKQEQIFQDLKDQQTESLPVEDFSSWESNHWR
ncbi:hypothetical protein K9M41_01230 [Candidatus Gracilibacteria bacterium]|nr:hypothetical protein [Candidatus Gracilibacteria bacterium]